MGKRKGGEPKCTQSLCARPPRGAEAAICLPPEAEREPVAAIYVNGPAQEAMDLAEALCALPRREREGLRPAALIALEPLDWNRDLSPWPEPGIRPGEDFAGGAAARLRLVERAKAELEARYPLLPGPENSGIFGYSLGGLMALYALCESRSFGLCGALSASLWYEGFLDYLRERAPAPGARVYLSLGKKEEKVRSPRYARVGDSVRQAHGLLAERSGRKTCACSGSTAATAPSPRAGCSKAQVAAGAAMMQCGPPEPTGSGGRVRSIAGTAPGFRCTAPGAAAPRSSAR